jgi:hypothetical protein
MKGRLETICSTQTKHLINRIHRMIEYTVKVHTNGDKHWYLNDERHREDGPAVENSDGGKSWWLNGKLHREDGPAIEHGNGNKAWYLNDKLHREDGPAMEYSDGYKAWFLNDEYLTEEGFNERMTPEVGMTIDEMEKVLGMKVNMLNLEHKWLKTLLKRSPTVEMTMEEICKALGKTVKVIK